MPAVDFTRAYKPGDKIRLVDGRGEHVASIDEVTASDTMVVIQPWDRNVEFSVEIGQTMDTVCYNARGVQKCVMEVISKDKSQNVDTITLKYRDKYNIIQNRRAYRCDISIPVEIRKSGEAWERTRTLDLSTAGLRVRISSKFKLGDHIQVQLLLDHFGFDIMLPIMSGTIVRATPTPDSTHEVMCGIDFDNLNSSTEDTLSKFVNVCQRKNAAWRTSE